MDDDTHVESSAFENNIYNPRDVVLAFKDEKIRAICTHESRAIIQIGKEAAAQLVRRLADLRAAENMGDLDWMVGEEENSTEPATYFVDLSCGAKMIFQSNHQQTGRDFSMRRLSRVKIIAITD